MNDHLDVIALRGLSAVGSHGVYDFERHGSQVFSADLKLFVDSRRAAETDDVAYTVDYSQLAEKAVEILSGTPVYLIETLASNLADMALGFPLVQKVEVTVHKPMAPVRHQFEDVSVRVTRSRAEAEERLLMAAPEIILTPEDEPAQVLPPTTGGIVRDVAGRVVEQSEADEPVVLPLHLPSRLSLFHAEPVPELPFPSRREVHQSLPAVVSPTPGATTVSIVSAEEAIASKGALSGAMLIPRSFEDGSRIYRMVLSLGSNKGDSLKTLSSAVATLSSVPGIEIEKVSPVVRTLPVLEPGALPQDDFQNIAVIGRTVLPPPVLLQVVNKVEADFGRVRGRRWAPRTLDIDIIDMDSIKVTSKDLTLPHPRAHERAFVLYPWSLVAPQDELRGHGPIRSLLVEAPDMQGLLSVRENWLGEDGTVVPGDERILRERPVQAKLTDRPDLFSVTVRGEQLHLVPIEFDPIFSKLMAREMEIPEPEVTVPVEAAKHVNSESSRSPRHRASGSVEPDFSDDVPQPEEQLLTRSSAAPKRQTTPEPIAGNPSQAAGSKNQNKGAGRLPDWRAAAGVRTRKVVDEGAERASTHAVPATTGSISTGRRVTMRPTPTGSFPVTGKPGQSE